MTWQSITISAGVFLLLFASHGLSLWFGWKLGTKTSPEILLSTPGKAESGPYHDGPDPFDEEMLDVD